MCPHHRNGTAYPDYFEIAQANALLEIKISVPVNDYTVEDLIPARDIIGRMKRWLSPMLHVHVGKGDGERRLDNCNGLQTSASYVLNRQY